MHKISACLDEKIELYISVEKGKIIDTRIIITGEKEKKKDRRLTEKPMSANLSEEI